MSVNNKIPKTYQDYESESYDNKRYYQWYLNIVEMEKNTPNDLELGNKIRKFVKSKS